MGRDKVYIATLITVVFHIIGLIGIFMNRQWIINSSAVNLLLAFLLVIYTQEKLTIGFWLCSIVVFLSGMCVEIVGVNSGLLFGNYKYGTNLGPQYMGVPLILGINWILVIFSCGAIVSKIMSSMSSLHSVNRSFKTIAFIIDAATLAVLFDFLIEPVAIKLKYWEWMGDIPVYNYVCWFFISAVLLSFYSVCEFNKQNKFLVNLFLIQVMFFLIIRTFL